MEAVHGNADEPSLRAVLPAELTVTVEGVRIGMTHAPGPASGREVRLAERFRSCDVVVYGHTHVPRLARVGRQWIVNPGSPTERRRAPARSMLELKVRGDDLRPRLVDLP